VMRSLIGDWFRILEGPLRWLSWQNFLTALRLCYNQRLRIFIYGNSPHLDNIRQNPLMSPCSLEPPFSAPRREFGKVGPLVSGKCRFFMCLVAHNKCWTANRLAKRNLPHPECCPLCYQLEETIDHLLVSYVFTWQVWFNLLQRVGLQILTPQVEVESFDDWWEAASKRVEG
jgi:hypothetical protein